MTVTATKTAKKQYVKIGKSTTLHVHHTFLYISLSLHDYNVKVPNVMFCRGQEHKTTTFLTWLTQDIQCENLY